MSLKGESRNAIDQPTNPRHSGTSRSKKVRTLSVEKALRRAVRPTYSRAKGRPSLIILGQEKHAPSIYKNKYDTFTNGIALYLSGKVNIRELLQENAEVLQMATKADGIMLYMVNETRDQLISLQKKPLESQSSLTCNICEDSTVAAHVAFHKEYVMVDDLEKDERFPAGLGDNFPAVKAVLCVPLMTPDEGLLAVLELYKVQSEDSTPFTMVDLQIIVLVTGWMGATIHQNELRKTLQAQRELQVSLLEVIKSFLSEAVTFETMLYNTIQTAKKLVGAERGSFFVVYRDETTDEVIADHYEEGIDDDGGGSGSDRVYRKRWPIQFANLPGIVREVVKTGVAGFVNDALTNPKYRREVDPLTGHVTLSSLCVPINSVDGVIGIIQLLNKGNDENFNNHDEKLVSSFNFYCILALNFFRIQNDIRKARVTKSVSVNLLKFHNQPCSHDRKALLAAPVAEELPPGFHKFGWYFTNHEDEMLKLLYFMITDLVDKSCFNEKNLCIFILTVKKTYRHIPYHNFDHAFTFTHCMYNILKRNTDLFTPTENKSLMIASLCHDIDHRGFTNNFMQINGSELYQLYPESCMENHHVQTTMHIVQSTNVYSAVTAEEYRDIVDEIHDAIISTDLTLYFRCRPRLTSIVLNNEFDWEVNNHRVLVKSMMMTTCDLSGQCKPFPVAKKITESLYREFYHQGDLEKEMGLTPLSMMDREKMHTIPVDQMRFIEIVVLPCVDLLAQIIPNTIDLYNLAKDLRHHWEGIVETKTKIVSKCSREK